MNIYQDPIPSTGPTFCKAFDSTAAYGVVKQTGDPFWSADFIALSDAFDLRLQEEGYTPFRAVNKVWTRYGVPGTRVRRAGDGAPTPSNTPLPRVRRRNCRACGSEGNELDWGLCTYGRTASSRGRRRVQMRRGAAAVRRDRPMKVSQLRANLDRRAVAARMRALIEELYPICRSITGDGLRETLRADPEPDPDRAPRGAHRHAGPRLDGARRVEHPRRLRLGTRGGSA